MSQRRRVIYDLIEEPRGEIYRKLVDCALIYCDVVLLVVPGSKPTKSTLETLERLSPFLSRKSEESEWPGTKLLGAGAGATVYYYRFTSESAAVLKNITSSLYSWCQPKLPEDLCFLRIDQSPWLVSIAHEQDSYLELTEDERSQLAKLLPELQLIRFTESQ